MTCEEKKRQELIYYHARLKRPLVGCAVKKQDIGRVAC
jgi:hypothetical protein